MKKALAIVFAASLTAAAFSPAFAEEADEVITDRGAGASVWAPITRWWIYANAAALCSVSAECGGIRAL